jgi:hypothetical protein
VFVLIVGALIGGLLGPGFGGSAGAPQARSTAPTATAPAVPPPLEARSATDPVTKVQAWVDMRAQEWGTALTVRLTGAPQGARCRLYAVAKNGRRDVAGAWQYGGREYEQFNGSTMIARADLSRFEIVTTNGHRLVVIPA